MDKNEKIEEAKKLQSELDELLQEIGLEEEIEEECKNEGTCGCKCNKNKKLANPDSKMIKYG